MRPAEPAGNPLTMDRLPPHSTESEVGVLGCILLSPAECLSEAIAKLKNGEAFYDLRLRTVFEALVAMSNKNLPVDVITLQQWLKDRQQLEACGGLPFIASLPDAVPSAKHLDYYIPIVREKHMRRRTIQVCTEVVGRVYEHEGDIDPLLDGVEKHIMDLRSDRLGACDWEVKGAVRDAIKEIESYAAKGGKMQGLPSGFIDLDLMTGGLMPGHMIVIAGRPSTGKSSIALNIADHVAVEHKVPTGYFSFEMDRAALMKRALSARARVNLRWVRDGFLNAETTQRLSNAYGRLAGAPLFLDDRPSQNIAQVRSKARRMRLKHGIELLVIDYLQLLHGHPGKRYRSDAEELTDVSNAMKELARELKIPVIVLSQLNREVEREKKTRKPRMSDLKGSGSLEQDGDLIGILYRASRENRHKPAEDGEDDEFASVVPVNLLICKQRDGQTGDLHMTFLKSFTRFECAAKIENTDQEQMNYAGHNDP